MSFPSIIRPFQPGDEPSLRRVFESAIHGVASRDYSPEQIQAWAPADHDPVQWAVRMQTLRPFVAVMDGEIVAYADVQPSGYIDHFFVSGDRPRQGIGTRLMDRLHREAMALGIAELTSDVSLTAEPFFLRHGFEVVERRFPVRGGVTLQNALMRKRDVLRGIVFDVLRR